MDGHSGKKLGTYPGSGTGRDFLRSDQFFADPGNISRDMQSYEARERIAPVQARLTEVVGTIRGYSNREYMTIMKERYNERHIAYFNEDAGSWAIRLCDLTYLRRYTMSYPRPYEAGPVHVPAIEQTARWLAVAEM